VGPGRWWWAVWESGPGAVLDGVTALQAAGLTGWSEPVVHVSVPARNRVHRLEGVRVHRLRTVAPVMSAGVPRTRPEVAAVRAAVWAPTDRQAATVLAMTMQQRLAHPRRVEAAWAAVSRCARRELLHEVVRDVCDGAHSLAELDFARMCRRRGLPEPTRQVVRRGPRGRIYLDVGWEELDVSVEIDGAQHTQGLAAVDDAVRHNHRAIGGGVSLRIPVLGLRVQPEVFLDQVAAALDRARWRLSA
jgi:very-short-patch-repair endonuclease